uniref:Tyrosine-protein phosphatase domain-containing protein n=1 Tax=Ascaris lumbricoides TaxID=6252 RepID=A0A9J2PCX3_ASCLU
MDSTQTARELPNRSWFRRSLRRKTSPNDYTQESTKTAREHRQSISRRPNSTPHPRQDHEGEEMTQEQDSEISMSINGFNRGKTQNEIQAWVDRMLDKGVRGLRQEFTLLRVATKPTADKYQQFTVNAPFAWVDRMLDKGVRGLRQEFTLLRVATKPTADKYQQFTVNAPFGRNRYKDVFCLDESRIVLRNHPSGNDYIHANYVSTPMKPNRFICAQIRSTKRPICVHCSAGIGRTGSIVAIEYILERLKANASCDDLIDIVKQLRKQRAGIVQTDLQYLYVHRVMLIYFTDMKLITESDRLSNFIHEYEQLIPPFQ